MWLCVMETSKVKKKGERLFALLLCLDFEPIV